MDIFGIGLPEMLLILVVALLVFGPGKLPEIGAALGRAVSDFRRATRELSGDLQESLSEARTEVEDTVSQAKSELQSASAAAQREAQPAANAASEAPAEDAAIDEADKKWLELGMASQDGDTSA